MTHRILAVAFLAVLVGSGSDAVAQNHPVFDATGFQPHRDYFSQLPFEHIDPVTGSVLLTYTDLVLPGNAGRDVRFQRTYNSKGAFGGAAGTWTFGVAGIPLWVEDTWPNTPESNPLLHTADGGAAAAATPLYPMVGGDYAAHRSIMMTDRFWKYYRSSRILWLPDGTVATYDNAMRLSTVTDAFGNTVLSIAYDLPTVTVTQHLGNGQSRDVVVELPPNCTMGVVACVPTSMEYLGRTWTYTGGGYHLAEVQPPVGPSWRWEYGGAGSLRTVTAVTPHGGSVTYTIDTIEFPWTDGETLFTDVVRFRETTDVRGGQSSGLWEYEYEWDSPDLAKVSRIIAPDGTTTTYEHTFVFGSGGVNYPGRMYLATRRTVRDGQTVLEDEAREYEYVPIPSASGLEAVPQVTVRRITRDGREYTTTLVYSGNNYGDFHQPASIIETGELSRTTTRTFTHSPNAPHASPYLVGLVTQETIEEPAAAGGQTVASSWAYDTTTGFLTSDTRAGITTTFTPDAYGNVASVTKANGTAVSYAYSWGQVREIATAAHVTTRSVNPDGTVASETVGGLTTMYVHDALSRLTSARPPGYPAASDEFVTTYDNTAGAGVAVTRGASQIVTTLDGFGRAIATTDSLGIRSTTRYDAQGRTTFAGYPVDGVDADIGTQIQYDALGRLKRLTHPDGSISQRSYGPGTVTITDENQRTSVQTWKAFGHPDDARLAAATDASGHTWTYTYNVAGQLVTVGAAGGISRTSVYNGNFLLEREMHPESGETTYAYDAAGVLFTTTDANTTTTTHVYDGNERLTQVTAGSTVTETRYEPGSDRRR